LSDNNSSDNTRVIEQLKYKADYLYAQSKYTEAIKCYEQLSQLIPPSNTVLTQEVCESRVMCLTKLDETEQAETCLKQMVCFI
jgi:tetratricopeptide (TPR) repeat protein